MTTLTNDERQALRRMVDAMAETSDLATHTEMFGSVLADDGANDELFDNLLDKLRQLAS